MPIIDPLPPNVGTLIVTVSQAATYFSTRVNTSEWDAMVAADDTGATAQIAALTTAQNFLDLLYTLDTEEETHRNAVCEQANYFVKYGVGIEDRLSLINQGTMEAGLIKEKYRGPNPYQYVCSYAQQALLEVKKRSGTFSFSLLSIGRDENEARSSF